MTPVGLDEVQRLVQNWKSLQKLAEAHGTRRFGRCRSCSRCEWVPKFSAFSPAIFIRLLCSGLVALALALALALVPTPPSPLARGPTHSAGHHTPRLESFAN